MHNVRQSKHIRCLPFLDIFHYRFCPGCLMSGQVEWKLMWILHRISLVIHTPWSKSEQLLPNVVAKSLIRLFHTMKLKNLPTNQPKIKFSEKCSILGWILHLTWGIKHDKGFCKVDIVFADYSVPYCKRKFGAIHARCSRLATTNETWLQHNIAELKETC